MDSASDTRSVRSRFGPQSKAFVVSLNKKYSPYCLVQVGARYGFERNFTIKLK